MASETPEGQRLARRLIGGASAIVVVLFCIQAFGLLNVWFSCASAASSAGRWFGCASGLFDELATLGVALIIAALALVMAVRAGASPQPHRSMAWCIAAIAAMLIQRLF